MNPACNALHALVRVADLSFHHHQRNTIHEQHNVRNDELFALSGRIDPELVDRLKHIAFRMREVDEFHHWIWLTRQLSYVDLGLEKQLLYSFVCLQPPMQTFALLRKVSSSQVCNSATCRGCFSRY